MSKLLKLAARSLLVGSLFVLTGFRPLQQEPPEDADVSIHLTQVDASAFPQITVYVSVTDAAGEPVGIDPARIVLSEDGAGIAPDHIGGAGEIGPLTTLLVMDVSGSMNNAGKLKAAKAAAQTYVTQMRSGDQAGLLTFNTQIAYPQPITADQEALVAAIGGLRAQNDTSMYDALVEGVQILEGVTGRKAIIVLTDGLDNRSTRTADEVIEQIGPSGLSISTIGLGDPSQLGVTNDALDEATLRSLAARAGGGYGFADDPDALRALYEQYGRALQSEYVITYTSPSTLYDGVNRRLAVSLADAETAAVAEGAYNPGGVVPEVSERASWPLFAVILAALLGLLLVPLLLRRGALAVGGLIPGRRSKKRSRIKLRDERRPRIRLR